MNEADLQHYLDAHIPPSRALGVRVEEVGTERVRLSAPLEPNLNHRQTAFGGSVASLAVLAGWSWLHARLAAHQPVPALVVQQQTVEYLAPIDDAFEAICVAPSAAAWQRFDRALSSRGRGRLELMVEVRCRGRCAATFRGLYVAVAAD